MSRDYFKESEFNDHAAAIGYLCMVWARLDYTLSVAMGRLLGIEDAGCMKSLGVNTRLKGKAATIRAAALQKRPNDEWFESIDELMKHISDGSQSLRDSRNRYIHDYWYISENGPQKVQLLSKIEKPQSHQPRELKTSDPKPVSADEIWDCAEQVSRAQIRTIQLIRQYLEAQEPPPE